MTRQSLHPRHERLAGHPAIREFGCWAALCQNYVVTLWSLACVQTDAEIVAQIFAENLMMVLEENRVVFFD